MDMKKTYRALFSLYALCAILLFTGCTGEKITAENHDWEFSLLQNAQTVEVTACSNAYAEIYENAAVVELLCEADGNAFHLRNGETNETWSLNYTLSDRKADSVFYTLHLEGTDKSGIGSIGITEYANGDSEYTLILTIDGHSLTFRKKIG